MDSDFKAIHLLISELNYELRIRDVVSTRNQDEKRKILGRLLDKERQQNIDVRTLRDPDYKIETEKVEIEATLDSIQTLIADFNGPASDSTYKRAFSRILRLTYRIQRITLNPEDPHYKENLDFKNEAYASGLNTSHNSSTSGQHSVHNNLNISQQNVAPSYKSIPVYKLNVQFDGEPKNLLHFIERIEELAQARHITKAELFDSAYDLFTGKATFWYRQVKSQVTDWESLVRKLKKDFLTSDFDDEVWNQIKARKQGRFEPVVIFIACVETLFSRLSRPPAEITKVKFIRLALHNIGDIATLSSLCKKLEEADILSLASSSRSVSSLGDPELAYISDNQSNHSRQKGSQNNSK